MLIRVMKILGILAAILVLIVVGLVATAYFGGDRVVAYLLRHEAPLILGRDLKYSAVHLRWGRPLVIEADDVELANVEGGKTPDVFSAKHLELAVDGWTLLRGPTVIPRLVLTGAALHLEKTAGGEVNWHVFKAAAPQSRSQFPELREFDVDGGSLTFDNAESGAHSDLELASFKAGAPNATSPVSIAAEGSYQQLPLSAKLEVGPLAELRQSSTPFPVKLDGTLGESHLAIDGAIAEPLDLEGIDVRIAGEGPDLQKFLAPFGVPLAQTPRYHLAGHLTHTGNLWQIQELDGRIGQSRLTGELSVDTGGKVPYLKAKLASPLLDIADMKGFVGGAPGRPGTPTPPRKTAASAKDDRVIPDAEIALDRLKGLNADLVFDGKEVRPLPGLPVQRLQLVLSLKDGVLRLQPVRFGVADGEAQGDLDLDGTARPPGTSVDFELSRLDIHHFLAGLDVPKMVKDAAGKLGGFVKLSGKGVNERAWFADTKGDIGLFMEGGHFSQLLLEFVDLDILEALGIMASGDKPVPINCVAARFAVDRGVATISTLLFDTTDTLVVGRGSVNFGDETLFLELTPYSKGFTPLTLRTPIEVRGTFRHPTFSPNAVGIAGRLGAAIGLGILAPPAALLALIDTGLGQGNNCERAFKNQTPPGANTPSAGAAQTPPAAKKPSAEVGSGGSSVPKK